MLPVELYANNTIIDALVPNLYLTVLYHKLVLTIA